MKLQHALDHTACKQRAAAYVSIEKHKMVSNKLFVCGLISEATNNSKYAALKDKKMVNNDLEKKFRKYFLIFC